MLSADGRSIVQPQKLGRSPVHVNDEINLAVAYKVISGKNVFLYYSSWSINDSNVRYDRNVRSPVEHRRCRTGLAVHLCV